MIVVALAIVGLIVLPLVLFQYAANHPEIIEKELEMHKKKKDDEGISLAAYGLWDMTRNNNDSNMWQG